PSRCRRRPPLPCRPARSRGDGAGRDRHGRPYRTLLPGAHRRPPRPAAPRPHHRRRRGRAAGGSGLMALGTFFSRLKQGLARSTEKLATGITAVFTKRKLDDAALDDLENILITADLGTAVAARVIAAFRRTRFGKEVTDDEVK